mgnify:CR=1 FL=1|tara:strand:+ start:60 stop:191 length:132 start_codon:yes stop_codon:yes gene_type:complete
MYIELIAIVLFFIIGMICNKGFKINNKLEENIRIYEKEKKENR